MAPSKFGKAIGAVKDTTSIGLAKVGSSSSLSNLDVVVVKATRHEEYPAEERHIREILGVTSFSRAHIGACVAAISRRLNKTKNWVVALKTLILVQRLLNEGDPTFEQEVFFTTRRGTRLLNMSDFRDTRRKDSWDYSAFVRTYAYYLDEQLEYKMHTRRGRHSAYGEDEEEEGPAPLRTTPVRDMRNEHVFSRVHHLMQLLERFLACRPTGTSKHNRVVLMALYPIVKESFQIYYDLTETLGILIDRFVTLELADCAKVYEIFSHVSKQFEDLDKFYVLCKSIGIARSSEYPEVDKITQKKLDVMDDYIKDKSTPAHNKRVVHQEQKQETNEEDKKSRFVVEEDMNAIKALPPPEGFPEEPEKEKKEEAKEEEKEKDNPAGKEADLLNLGGDAVTSEEHEDKFTLALFDDGAGTIGTGTTATTTAWEAFKDTNNWETELVESTTHLWDQKPSLPGGFDTMLLDGMYQQGVTNQAMALSGYAATGSASSIAFGSAGRPAMLALPAPHAAGGMTTPECADPFAASLPVPPPPYVQMTEMEKKQRLLMEEQLMWQQYARDGMPGQVGLTKVQQNPYPCTMGSYTRTY